MNTSTSLYLAEPTPPPCCLTIKTGRSDCYALFNPSLYQLTLVKGERVEKIDLGYSGSRLLERLLKVPGEVVSRDELMNYAWADRVVGQGSLNQQIYTLRQVLGDEKNREIIQTLPRRGYQINPGYLATSANDSEENPTQDAHPAPSLVQRYSHCGKFWMRLLTGLSAIGVGLFAYLVEISQATPAAYTSTLKQGNVDMLFIEQSPQRLEQLISSTQALSERLNAMTDAPTQLTLIKIQDFYQLVCQHSKGNARTFMFHTNQLNLLKDAQLHRCLT